MAKHGVSFQQAATVFGDPVGRMVTDPRHSWEVLAVMFEPRAGGGAGWLRPLAAFVAARQPATGAGSQAAQYGDELRCRVFIPENPRRAL